jgi:hypothetical protein
MSAVSTNVHIDRTPRLSAANGTTRICFNMTFQYTCHGAYKLFIRALFYSCIAGDDDSGPHETRMIVILSARARPLKAGGNIESVDAFVYENISGVTEGIIIPSFSMRRDLCDGETSWLILLFFRRLLPEFKLFLFEFSPFSMQEPVDGAVHAAFDQHFYCLPSNLNLFDRSDNAHRVTIN